MFQVQNTSKLDLEVGQEMRVKYYGHDSVTGAVRLSRKALTVAASQAVRTLRASARRTSEAK